MSRQMLSPAAAAAAGLGHAAACRFITAQSNQCTCMKGGAIWPFFGGPTL